MKRWDFSLEGKVCPICNGKGAVLEIGVHLSKGIIPCPRKYFQGHGYPICENGILHFNEYDIKNKDMLIKKYTSN